MEGGVTHGYTGTLTIPMGQFNGYEAIAAQWLAKRGNPASRDRAIGVDEVRRWARSLPSGGNVVDVGCGPGVPLTTVLIEEGLRAYGVDASATFVAAFQRNLPEVPVACASALDFDFFGRTFDAVLAVGLIFLMHEEEQRQLLRVFARILKGGGRLLFTAPAPPCTWVDVMTGLPSVSLGAEEYRRELALAGLNVLAEFEDVGENHYFDAQKIVSSP